MRECVTEREKRGRKRQGARKWGGDCGGRGNRG